MRLAKPIAALALLLCGRGYVYAQLGATIVSDPPVESATTDMDTVQEPGILAQDTLTAQSVTTGGGAGLYTPINGIGSQQNQQLFTAATNFSQDFPGWQSLPATSTLHAQQIVSDMLNTYSSALGIAQSQGNELAGEDLSAIEQANASATAVLQALQVNTEAVLALNNQLQMLRQAIIALVTVEATHHAAEISIVAQDRASLIPQMLLNPHNQPELMSSHATRPNP